MLTRACRAGLSDANAFAQEPVQAVVYPTVGPPFIFLPIFQSCHTPQVPACKRQKAAPRGMSLSQLLPAPKNAGGGRRLEAGGLGGGGGTLGGGAAGAPGLQLCSYLYSFLARALSLGSP